ncbi:MAG: PDZ domain-containing protein [Demequinaceae bacterium]|nr:PDZ domain-containing protein [Demequinaceae bacterium]
MTDPDDDVFLALSERPTTRKAGVMAATGLLTSLLIAVLTILPSPYAIEEPGPTYDTLASKDGVPLVAIEGAPTYDSTGELRLTTVSLSTGDKRVFTVGRVLEAFISSESTVAPVERVYRTPQEQEQEAKQSADDWISSQESATVSALEASGVVVPATMKIASILDTSNAQGLLDIGDVITAADGEQLVSYSDLSRALRARKPGDSLNLTVLRGGQSVDVTFDLIAAEDGRALMGVSIDPTFDLPIHVKVDIDRVGGPSAGMMFALAIMDKLTPEDELRGAKIAGTGEIYVDGKVYPIGGIRYKLDGARAAGAEYFLAPVDNCPDVMGHIPAGLSVYAVNDLTDAYDAIVAIGQGKTEGLPTCSTVAAMSQE